MREIQEMRLDEGSQRVQSVERAVRLLEILAEATEMSLGDLAVRAGIHKSTTYRLLHTLKELGYVVQDEEQGHYRVGLRLVEIGGRAMRSWPLHRAAEPAMEDLAETLGEAVNLAVEDDLSIVYVATVDARNLLRMQLKVGRRAPMHCTAVGKAILAVHPALVERLKEQNGELAALTPRTLVQWRDLEAELARVRSRGFAIDDEEQEIGARCVAAAILDPRGRVQGAIGISAPSARLSLERAQQVGPTIVEAAQSVSRHLL
ncbi:IclR family transcriptional regulator [Sulfobacillus harzensis]|uniref:Glycerol operon regulatory protein n=1 Tax=Sulfobacillus harzensis TaxID=2729629 RepID=A0A7Y0L7I8_9FIRM|nr:IclR family transcriptional regulator [Sulfobacillus harzensis]NMP23865.1 IclR family transcriptional regulator [Sulfobacillus harzensis]